MTNTTSNHRTALDNRPGDTVRANGIDIHYVEAGSGEPLVLLAGGGISHGPAWAGAPIAYTDHIATLAEHFRVIAPDTRGAGATAHPTDGGTVTYPLLAQDVVALCEALGAERPMVCGFSDGGLIATVLGIMHPTFARAIVNDAGFDLFDPEAPSMAMFRTLFGGRPDATEFDPAAVTRAIEQMPMMAGYFAGIRADADGAHSEGAWQRVLELGFHRASRSPGYTFDDLAAIEVPTLMLVGDRDLFCTVEDGVKAYRKLRQGELGVIANHPHAIMAPKVAASTEFFSRHQFG